MAKKVTLTRYDNSTIWLDRLSNSEKEKLDSFLADVSSRITALSRSAQKLMLGDFALAVNHLLSKGVSLDEALRRLDGKNLEGFYLYPAKEWFPLDNAAKAYPFSMKHDQMPMFRLSCYLKDYVEPEILQVALLFTIQRFPSFATTLKKGFFWHYLDATKRHFNIENEQYLPCKSINVGMTGSQSFRVVYYRKRISVEFFHVLTDGSGGMVFLKTLVSQYLRLLGHEFTPEKGVLDTREPYKPSEVANEFAEAELKRGISGFMGSPAVQMSGKIERVRPYAILHFCMDTASLKEVCRRYECTVTAYILACMMLSIRHSTEGVSGSVKIQVPINMRKFNGSDTLRNYSMYFNVDATLGDIRNKEEMISIIKQQLSERSRREEMEKMMSTTIKMVSSLKYIPLSLKAPVASIGYGYMGDSLFTSCLSNLGVVEMPEELAEFVDMFDFVLGVSPTNRAACALVTYGSNAVLSITKNTKDPLFEEKMYELLTDDGVVLSVNGSMENED